MEFPNLGQEKEGGVNHMNVESKISVCVCKFYLAVFIAICMHSVSCYLYCDLQVHKEGQLHLSLDWSGGAF
uniref:Uncharacterized protein n=1 Tax=Chenopodium quinoa TaxID=63459 RepID=A0A803KVU5_CHEQI